MECDLCDALEEVIETLSLEIMQLKQEKAAYLETIKRLKDLYVQEVLD